MKRMTPERAREIDELRAGITLPADWRVEPEKSDPRYRYIWCGPGNHKVIAGEIDPPDAAFIAAAPQIVDEYKAEIEALRRKVLTVPPCKCCNCGATIPYTFDGKYIVFEIPFHACWGGFK